jgi:hypothetical protein
VDIDPAGRYDGAVTIDFRARGPCLTTNLGQAAIIDSDIACRFLPARTINDSAAANYQIMHVRALFLFRISSII